MPTRCNPEDITNALKTISACTELTENEGAALQQILDIRPQLARLIQKYAKSTLEEYAEKIITKDRSISDAAQSEIVSIVKNYLPTPLTAKLEKNLIGNFTIDTAAHGGIISEDCLLQGHIISTRGAKTQGLDIFLTLECGVVPMNNGTWPRGFYFNQERISLFSKQTDRIAFHECPGITKDIFDKKIKEYSANVDLKNFIEWISEIPSLFELPDYAAQCSLINTTIWNTHLKGSHASELIQLPLEELTARLLIKSFAENDALCRFIFCPQMFSEVLPELADLPGTWSPDQLRGTFLFWLRSGDFRAASVFPNSDGTALEGQGKTVQFNAEEIHKKLSTKEMVPSVFLSLITLLHHGIRPLGGYHQSWYLPEYRKRLSTILEKHKHETCPTFLEKIQCEDLVQLGYGLAFLKSSTDETKLAGLETFFNSKSACEDAYSALSRHTVAESIKLPLKRWYSEIVPKNEQTISL